MPTQQPEDPLPQMKIESITPFLHKFGLFFLACFVFVLILQTLLKMFINYSIKVEGLNSSILTILIIKLEFLNLKSQKTKFQMFKVNRSLEHILT